MVQPAKYRRLPEYARLGEILRRLGTWRARECVGGHGLLAAEQAEGVQAAQQFHSQDFAGAVGVVAHQHGRPQNHGFGEGQGAADTNTNVPTPFRAAAWAKASW